ncbi:MAG: SUMF1/EgtB/PvdO family nonheme iron enzyme [Chitinivibrionales bacterium]|nr:SUMF1/EgtB/PvdO family nonheme iron enzyme [Chitinivibrionales bacterium]
MVSDTLPMLRRTMQSAVADVGLRIHLPGRKGSAVRTIIVLTGVILCGIVHAANADIVGRVVDRSAAPVADATVTLRQSGQTATSGADGSFTLNTTEALRGAGNRGIPVQIRVHRGMVVVTLDGPRSSLNVAVFGVDGRLMARPAYGRYGRGTHRFALPAAGRGMRIVRVVVDGVARTVRVLPVGAGESHPEADVPVTVMSVATGGVGLDPVDTIAVRKLGHAGATRVVTSLDTDVGDIVLPDVDPGMVLIPARDSSFEMGQSNDQIDGYTTSDEQPVHTVTFSYDFYMDTVEVTQADYKAVGGWAEGPFELASPTFQRAGISDDRPAHSVNWLTAVLYCNARSQRDGLDTVYEYSDSTQQTGNINNYNLADLVVHLDRNGYRLPTEAEWEYAYGAGDDVDLYWAGGWVDGYPADAADSAQIDSFAVYRGNSSDLGFGDPAYGTQPVASRRPNGFGLYDMSGNVREWCNDWYSNSAYEADSGGVIDPTGPQGGSDKVVRGGSWEDVANRLRGTDRNRFNEVSYARDVGFRVVLPVR